MSFILDALKKLEHKRQRSSVPNLLTVHDSIPEEPKRRSPWLYLLLVALLLNAGILLVWLRPWQAEKSTKENSLPKPTITVPAPVVKQNIVPQSQRVQSKADGHRTISGELVSPLNSEKGKGDTPTPQVSASGINHPSAESLSYVNTGSTSGQKVLDKSELPLSIQRELPNISIAGHIYSNDPASRIVNINGQIIREGETVAAGLKLEEITEYGVILSYKDYRFHMRGF